MTAKIINIADLRLCEGKVLVTPADGVRREYPCRSPRLPDGRLCIFHKAMAEAPFCPECRLVPWQADEDGISCPKCGVKLEVPNGGEG